MVIILVYAPKSENTKESFTKHEKVLNNGTNHKNIFIIMGNLNAKVGEEQASEMVSR